MKMIPLANDWYPRLPGKVSSFLMIAIMLLLFNGCATTEKVKYEPLLNYNFSPRSVQARITHDSAKTLESKGYYALGNISAFVPSNPGEEKKAATQLEEMLLGEAARQGGDVVRLDIENSAQKDEKKIPDKCLSWGEPRRTCSYEYVPYQECSGNKCVQKTRLENVCRDKQECRTWSYRYETMAGILSSGSVWRYDPQMKDIQQLSTGGFQQAAANGQIQIVKLFLKRKADVNAYDSEGFTALHRAAENGKLEVAGVLLDNGADVNTLDRSNRWNGPPLSYAAMRGHTEIVELLLSRGANINKRAKCAGWGEEATPLMIAAAGGNPAVMKIILKRGAKADETDKEGNTALHYAAKTKGPEVIRLLVAGGSRVDSQNKKGQTSLILAVNDRKMESVKALLAAGANKSIKDKDGYDAEVYALVALDHAERYGDAEAKTKCTEIVRLLKNAPRK